MTVRAVVLDWGGTLTPWHDLDLLDLWRAAAQRLVPADRVEEVTQALYDAERAWWRSVEQTRESGTIDDIMATAEKATGLDVSDAVRAEALSAHLEAFAPHTYTDPQAAPLLRDLRQRGIQVGLLSNTHWPRDWHEDILARDGVLDLIDERVYTSELAHIKPHPETFGTVLRRLGVAPAEAVFVGDRPYDDIHGATSLGMRGVLVAGASVPSYDVVPDATINQLSELLALIDAWR